MQRTRRCVGPHGLLAMLVAMGPALAAIGPALAEPQRSAPPPLTVQSLHAEVLARHDHGGRPFVVLDKPQARLWLFDAQGRPAGDTAVLLGAAVGDASVPGIGLRPLVQVLPHERTTPAGRFVLEPGRNLNGEDVWWVDYDAAVSMHRVRASAPAERRLERLDSSTPDDNRISYGCINVPAAFYDGPLRRLLGPDGRPGGVAYVLPETQGASRSPWAATMERSTP